MRRAVRLLPGGLLGVLVAGLLAVAGCGAGEQHNQADADLAARLVHHHADTIAVANTSIGRVRLDPAAADLAERTRLALTAEIDALAALLETWGEPVPETGFATGDGHTHEATVDPVVQALADADDGEFERRWLEAMVVRAEGAQRLAERLAAEGEDDGARELAQRMAGARDADLGSLRSLLGES